MFIIRNQGFFYTDEYFAPEGGFKQVVRKTFATKQAADKACAVLVRKWVRSEPIGNYVFDDHKATEAVFKYLRAEWPGKFDNSKWLHEVEIPKGATDKQVDEIVKRMNVTFAEVFEVETADGGDEDDDEDDADAKGNDLEDDEGYGDGDDMYYGPG